MKLIKERLQKVIETLENELNEWRPADDTGKPGGIILLRQDIPTLIVPDLHGRSDYLPDLMGFKPADKTVFELLKNGRIQIVCVGDGMHSERRGKERWQAAFAEYKNKFVDCPAMTAEMTENFQTMAMVMKLKAAFPRYFHFLKGNHENILDEAGNGNHPFAKFVAEGPMTTFYVKKFFGDTFLNQYDQFEKDLPLIARGTFFVVSHARPRKRYTIDQLINYRSQPDVIEGLTWTRHQNAEPGSIPSMLDELLGNSINPRYWFCGHTSLETRFKHWPEDALIEIHNPDLRTVAMVDPVTPFEMEKDIIDLPKP
ncbi:metallophosphoesterase [bacterium]|nr:metallophosphoesterase [bacterium]